MKDSKVINTVILVVFVSVGADLHVKNNLIVISNINARSINLHFGKGRTCSNI